MDKNRLIDLATAATESGICDAGLVERLREAIAIQIGDVSRENLLHIYRRRILRTVEGSRLRAETAALISFLERHQQDHLLMASVSLKEGGGELFLMNSSGDRILHWMSMFSK
ncbi:hypothetical protein ACFW1F_16405 [Streptomyces bungoensis]|uniref:hypothetical protein n=1 Tax=Streptomyces bungoensis TaxID=285568 RepID=UPI0034345E37